jgi:hypothetical protein
LPSGIVVRNNDPENRGRIKVICRGVYETENWDNLPWVYPDRGAGSGARPDLIQWDVPDLFTQVSLAFPTDDIYYATYSSQPTVPQATSEVFTESPTPASATPTTTPPALSEGLGSLNSVGAQVQGLVNSTSDTLRNGLEQAQGLITQLTDLSRIVTTSTALKAVTDLVSTLQTNINTLQQSFNFSSLTDNLSVLTEFTDASTELSAMATDLGLDDLASELTSFAGQMNPSTITAELSGSLSNQLTQGFSQAQSALNAFSTSPERVTSFLEGLVRAGQTPVDFATNLTSSAESLVSAVSNLPAELGDMATAAGEQLTALQDGLSGTIDQLSALTSITPNGISAALADVRALGPGASMEAVLGALPTDLSSAVSALTGAGLDDPTTAPLAQLSTINGTLAEGLTGADPAVLAAVAPSLSVAGADLAGGLDAATPTGAGGAHNFIGRSWSNGDARTVSWQRVDRETGSEEHYQGSSESLWSIDRDGNVTVKIKSLTIEVTEGILLKVGDDFHQHIAGAFTTKVLGRMDTDVAEALSIKTADALEIEAGGAANVKAGGVLGLDGSQIREQVNASSGAVGGSVVSDGEDSLEERIEQLTEQLAALKEQHDAVQEAGNAERTRLETLAREIRGDPLETA